MNSGNILMVLGLVTFIGSFLYDIYNLRELRKYTNEVHSKIEERLRWHYTTMKLMRAGLFTLFIGILIDFFISIYKLSS